jgi:hypothetical protein
MNMVGLDHGKTPICIISDATLNASSQKTEICFLSYLKNASYTQPNALKVVKRQPHVIWLRNAT